MWQQIKALNEKRGTILTEMRTLLKTAEDAGRDLTADEDAKFNDLNTRAEAVKSQIERHEKANQIDGDIAQRNAANPGKGPVGGDAGNGAETPEQRAAAADVEQRSQFAKYIRGASPAELRALTVSGQGIVGTRAFYAEIVKSMKAFAGVREAGASIFPTSNGNPIVWPTSDDTGNTARQVDEAASNTNTTEPTLGTKTMGAYKFDSDWIKVSVEMIRDAEYDIEGHVRALAAERIGRKFNTASTTGTGSGQVQGFAAAAATGKTAAAVAAIAYDELIDLEHSVDPAYRSSGRCRFMLHDLTLAAIRKLKDTAGQYIWAAGLAGQPSALLGYGYTVNNDMAVPAASAKSVAFGDFSKYHVRDVIGMDVVIAKELFIENGLYGYKVFSRHDGILTDSKALKLLAHPAS
ncbi:MAG: capsid protein [Phycisphaerales bacterium]|nr:capsid protein [Phycisphaerales bacterium]